MSWWGEQPGGLGHHPWGLRREDEELLGPSEEEQEGLSPGCAKFVRLQHPLMVRMLIQTSLEKIIQKGSTVKVPSMFRRGEDFIPRFLYHFLFKSWHFRCSRSAVVFPHGTIVHHHRFGAAGQSARQCLLEVLEARRAAREDLGLDAAENARRNLWEHLNCLWTVARVSCSFNPSRGSKKLDKSILSWCDHGVISRHKRTIKKHLFFTMGWNSRTPIGPLLLIPKAADWLWTAATHIPWPGTWVIWRKPLISSCWTTGTSQPSWTWSIGGSWVLGCQRRQMPGVEEFQRFPKMGPKPSHQKWPITSDDFGVSCFKQLSNV